MSTAVATRLAIVCAGTGTPNPRGLRAAELIAADYAANPETWDSGFGPITTIVVSAVHVTAVVVYEDGMADVWAYNPTKPGGIQFRGQWEDWTDGPTTEES